MERFGGGQHSPRQRSERGQRDLGRGGAERVGRHPFPLRRRPSPGELLRRDPARRGRQLRVLVRLLPGQRAGNARGHGAVRRGQRGRLRDDAPQRPVGHDEPVRHRPHDQPLERGHRDRSWRETEAGTPLGNITTLFGTSTPGDFSNPALCAQFAKPVVYPLHRNVRGALHHIDPNKYRILTVEIGLPNKPRDLCGGSIVRVVWHVAGETNESYSWGITLNSRGGANVLSRLNFDMAALPIDPGSPSQIRLGPGYHSRFPASRASGSIRTSSPTRPRSTSSASSSPRSRRRTPATRCDGRRARPAARSVSTTTPTRVRRSRRSSDRPAPRR